MLVTCLPLAALGWLGKRFIQQDAALETRRHSERLQNAANRLADRLTEVTASSEAMLPPATAWVLFCS